MKPAFRALLSALLLAALTGCAAQKTPPQDEQNRLLYRSAQQALDAGRFVLEIAEIRFTDGRPAKTVSNGYVRLRGTHADLLFGPDIYFANQFHDTPVHSSNASVAPEKPSRRGNPQYTLRIEATEGWQCHEMAVTLYKNTNECHVVVYTNASRQHCIDFTGYVHPYAPGRDGADD